jgi:hypothetical protein
LVDQVFVRLSMVHGMVFGFEFWGVVTCTNTHGSAYDFLQSMSCFHMLLVMHMPVKLRMPKKITLDFVVTEKDPQNGIALNYPQFGVERCSRVAVQS